MKTVLVTGCAGFIGFNLTKALLRKNNIVVGIDNINRAYNPRFKKDNITILEKSPRFTFYKKDITQKQSIEKVFQKHKIEKIIHLAARTGVRKSIQFSKLYKKVNVDGTKNLYELGSIYNIEQFIFASSSSVYGNTTKLPFSENNSLPKAPSPYAQSKQDAEKIIAKLNKQHKVPTTIFRLFSVYGPHGRPDMAPYIFTKAAFAKKAIKQYGNGNSARDYTYIEDIVNGFLLGLKEPFEFETINLGNNNPVALSELIETVEKNTKNLLKKNVLPAKKEESKKTCADTRKARKLLDWQPRTSFEYGMQLFVAWYKDNRLKIV